MTDSKNPNVIASWNMHSDGKHYHTTVCRNVWQIQDKRYIDRETAERWGLDECRYCADDYEKDNGTREHYEALVRAAKRRQAGGD